MVAAWSHHVVLFINLVSDLNVTSTFVQAPVAWHKTGEYFYKTNDVINLPAIAITIAIMIVLLIGIRETSIVSIILLVVKVIILLIFIFACAKHVDRKNYASFIPSNQGRP